MTCHRLRKQAIDRLLVDFLVNELDTNEDGNQSPKQRDCTQPQVDDDLFDVPDRDGTENQGAHDDENCEDDEVIEYLVSNAFAEGVAGDVQNLHR